jgi:Skp family chaperone for outer membrane proteins
MENGERVCMNWLAATLLVLFTAPLFAQTVPVIAVIDVQKVVSNSEVGKKALAAIKVIKDKNNRKLIRNKLRYSRSRTNLIKRRMY